jgi:hypothetical protein
MTPLDVENILTHKAIVLLFHYPIQTLHSFTKIEQRKSILLSIIFVLTKKDRFAMLGLTSFPTLRP